LSKKVDFGGPKVNFNVDIFGLKSLFKLIKKALLLPNLKGRACKLDFPALYERNLLPTLHGASF